MKKWLSKDLLADLMLLGSFLILFFTTLSLNKYIALYLLAIGLGGGSYLMMKGGK